MAGHILVIDEGTTSTRAFVFDRGLVPVAMAQQELELTYPQDGWVEQDAERIWQASLAVAKEALEACGGAGEVEAVGITNQRETTLIWERATGRPIGPAIVWQDRRTAPLCETLRGKGVADEVEATTGLLVDPYFSATKIAWLIEAHGLDRQELDAGHYAFGTIDSWLIWKLTGGRVHATDCTNAARTALMDLETNRWSPEMAGIFDVPIALLPQIRPSGAAFGTCDEAVLGSALPISAVLGDQQAALVGQGCLSPGQGKITLGTGAFLVANTGQVRPRSDHALLATRGYDTGLGQSAYALEGAIFNAGTVVKWLRDEMGLIDAAADSEAIAKQAGSAGGVHFVPAFTGLGAPHWDAGARGEITGITRSTRAGHIVRAGLEAVAYQTHDLLGAFAADGAGVETLRVDGGMAANDWLMQFMADVCDVQVERPGQTEMTALGAAAMAAFQLGWTTPSDWAGRREELSRFTPDMPAAEREKLLAGWRAAVRKATLSA